MYIVIVTVSLADDVTELIANSELRRQGNFNWELGAASLPGEEVV